MVLLVPFEIPVYASTAVAYKLKQNPLAARMALQELGRELAANDASGVSIKKYELAGMTVNMIALDSRRASRHTLNHEIAHLVLKNGIPSAGVSEQEAEAAADALALLLDIKRVGKDTAHIMSLMGQTAASLILDADTKHYSADALHSISQLREAYVRRLSVHEAVTLAEETGRQSRIERSTLNSLSDAFRPVRKMQDEFGTGLFTDVRMGAETFRVMERNRNNPHVFKAGRRFLNLAHMKELMLAAAAKSKIDGAACLD